MNIDFPAYVDSSMLAAYKSCPQKFYRTYLQHWKAKGGSVHLVAGKAFAKGLEVTRKAFYEESLDSESAISEGLKALTVAYGDFDPPSDSAKSLARMMGAFEYYWDNYPLELDAENSPLLMPSGKRAVEFSFSEPLDIRHPVTGDPILYVGKMDAIYRYAGGNYIIDEKTTSQLGASWSKQWELRGQFTGYGWGCARAGLKVDGAIVRGVSILKTKYETQQAITYRPEWFVDRWYEDTLSWVAAMIEDYKSGKFKFNFSDSCASYGSCAFTRVCSTQTPDPWLETDFERRVWNPILHEETVLVTP